MICNYFCRVRLPMKIRIVNGFALQTFAVYDFTYGLCTFIQNGSFFVTTEVKCCFLLKESEEKHFSVFEETQSKDI